MAAPIDDFDDLTPEQLEQLGSLSDEQLSLQPAAAASSSSSSSSPSPPQPENPLAVLRSQIATDTAAQEVPDSLLDEKQLRVINAALEGHHIYIAGQAGVGKSVLLRAIYRRLTATGKVVYRVAHNGIAAANIEGLTIHSYAGISGNDRPPYYQPRPDARQRIYETDVLIVDEISTVSNHMLAGLDVLLRQVKKRMELPFGGTQVIACGDFSQLRPVDDSKKRAEIDRLRGNVAPHGVKAMTSKIAQLLEPADAPITYCFRCKIWKLFMQHCFILNTVYRQSDQDFLRLLGEIREGQVSQWGRKLLASRLLCNALTPEQQEEIASSGPFQLPDDYVMLYSKRDAVAAYNNEKLSRITSDEGHTYVANQFAANEHFQRLLDNMPIPERIRIKVGARVMLKRNINSRLVNGSCGRVVGFAEIFAKELSTGLYRPIAGCIMARGVAADQLTPLSALDQHYAVPRAAMGDVSLPKGAVLCPQEILRRAGGHKVTYNGFELADFIRLHALHTYHFTPLPVVLFDNGECCVMLPLEWSIEEQRRVRGDSKKRQKLENGAPSSQVETIRLAFRIQVPLIHAWALSVHLSQSLTIAKLGIDLGSSIFEAGQAYVAVSRAQTLSGLLLRDLDYSKITACPEVKRFHQYLLQHHGKK